MKTPQLVAEVKKHKPKLDKDKYTDYLTTTAPAHLEYAESYTNKAFDTVPTPIISFVADACEYGLNDTGLESRSLGDVSYNFEQDYPPAMLRKLKPYKRVRF